MDFPISLVAQKHTIDKIVKPCRYGVSCKKPDCAYWHFNNKRVKKDELDYAFGKGNLLTSAVKYMPEKLSLYDINTFCLKNFNSLWTGIKIFPLNWTTTLSSYILKPHEYFLDFANEQLGGGTLTFGNVQEEILMRQLAILQHLFAGDHYKKDSMLSNNLMKNPIVIETNVLNQYFGGSELYGYQGAINASKRSNIRGMYKKCDPFSIYLICVALYRLKSGDQYCPNIIQNSLIALIKAFVTAILHGQNSHILQIILNIGNIGSGAFNNNVNVNFILQYIAICCAITFVNPTKPVIVNYHSYDKHNDDVLRKYAMPFLKICLDVGGPVTYLLKLISDRQTTFPSIWRDKQ